METVEAAEAADPELMLQERHSFYLPDAVFVT